MDFSEEEKNQNHPEKEFSEPENFIPVQEGGGRESVRLFLAQQKYFYRAGKRD